MLNEWPIEQVLSINAYEEELSELLVQVVEGGASIGFLPPMKRSEAALYWDTVISPDVLLFVALDQDRIVGSVQLQLSNKQNGSHRAEIAKLMTLPSWRRRGIGRALMQKAEERALSEGRSLLVLDTREGDPSNDLYASLGYIEAGRIPGYAESADGRLDATVFYYKQL
ncbi:GNAT family N-acetyltransferase [Paenibacillus sp. GCM10023252]|uniref:GNAT family N-acetyltransferase n=1 Tax=Paenibacillus sp. GCM10023252 TaxID=3252649 RepID=UPI003605D55C